MRKTDFLNGELDEEIYMEQLEGFLFQEKKRKCLNWLYDYMVKSLYGLKLETQQWHEKFDKAMMSNGFKINECD